MHSISTYIGTGNGVVMFDGHRAYVININLPIYNYEETHSGISGRLMRIMHVIANA